MTAHLFAEEGLDKTGGAAGTLISMSQLAVQALSPGEELAVRCGCCGVEGAAGHLNATP